MHKPSGFCHTETDYECLFSRRLWQGKRRSKATGPYKPFQLMWLNIPLQSAGDCTSLHQEASAKGLKCVKRFDRLLLSSHLRSLWPTGLLDGMIWTCNGLVEIPFGDRTESSRRFPSAHILTSVETPHGSNLCWCVGYIWS